MTFFCQTITCIPHAPAAPLPSAACHERPLLGDPHMEEQSQASRPRLTESQQSRLEFAHRDLDEARAADLMEMDGAALVLQIERLRARLHDVLSLMEETFEP